MLPLATLPHMLCEFWVYAARILCVLCMLGVVDWGSNKVDIRKVLYIEKG